LAFSIDAWWDGYKETSTRKELALALRADFEYTIAEVDAQYAQLEEHLRLLQDYLSLVDRNETEDLSSLVDRTRPAFQGISFEPSFAVYQSAVSTGTIALVNSRELSQAMTDFSASMALFDEYHRLASEMYFLGTGSDIRSIYGDLRVLRRDPKTLESKFRLDNAAIRRALTSELMYAHCYKMMIIKGHKMAELESIKDSLLAAMDALGPDI
jgi:hypothetical protein